MKFIKEINNIYRLKVPFEDLYTSVFLIKTEQGNALIDCATYASDVDEYVIPALTEMGVQLTDVKYLILTHHHGDHAGGRDRILQINLNIKVITKAQSNIFPNVDIYELKGHTLDCVGVFDKTTKTLISGDGLQGAGVGKYRCSLDSEEEYLKTIERIKNDKRIKNILFSHAYEPWYKDCAIGRKKVEKCLQDCINHIKGE